VPEVSVDTYLKRKNLRPYRRLPVDDVEVLVAPILVQQAKRIIVSRRRGLWGGAFEVEVEPRGTHFHSPACRH
jgi:hypothetical protein